MKPKKNHRRLFKIKNQHKKTWKNKTKNMIMKLITQI